MNVIAVYQPMSNLELVEFYENNPEWTKFYEQKQTSKV